MLTNQHGGAAKVPSHGDASWLVDLFDLGTMAAVLRRRCEAGAAGGRPPEVVRLKIRERACPYQKLHPTVFMMKSAKERLRGDPASLPNRTMERRDFVGPLRICNPAV